MLCAGALPLAHPPLSSWRGSGAGAEQRRYVSALPGSSGQSLPTRFVRLLRTARGREHSRPRAQLLLGPRAVDWGIISVLLSFQMLIYARIAHAESSGSEPWGRAWAATFVVNI